MIFGLSYFLSSFFVRCADSLLGAKLWLLTGFIVIHVAGVMAHQITDDILQHIQVDDTAQTAFLRATCEHILCTKFEEPNEANVFQMKRRKKG